MPRFRYTAASGSVLHSIPLGMQDRVDVVGDPENVCYEWVIFRAGQEAEHSDAAYGSPEAALRDGLSAWLDGKP